MQVWSVVSWGWRALRGYSVTFAVLFACGILGLSLINEFRYLLTRWHAPWYAWLIIPMIVIGYLAKKESQWLPDPEVRRKWSRRIFLGAIIIAVLLAVIRRDD